MFLFYKNYKRNIICCCHRDLIKKLSDLFVVKMILNILLYNCYVTTINQNFKLEMHILKKQSFLQTLKYLNIYKYITRIYIYISLIFKQYIQRYIKLFIYYLFIFLIHVKTIISFIWTNLYFYLFFIYLLFRRNAFFNNNNK